MTFIDWNPLLNLSDEEVLPAGLYICPTPIGNLMDITIRTLKVLANVDVIAAEDTRHTLKLLNRYGISKKLISYHEHNTKQRGGQLIEMLKQGTRIGLVSDAGMPGISDPGADVIALAIEQQIPVTVLPGPCAAITALVGSGLNTNAFLFAGFLDRQTSKRKKQIEELLNFKGTIILYEAPHRILATLKDLKAVGYSQNAVIARELTKKFEEFKRGTIENLLDNLEKVPPKGEIVLLIEGTGNQSKPEYTVEERAEVLISEGHSTKDVARILAKEMGISRNEIYQKLVSGKAE